MSEAELIDCATVGDALAQTAIGRRAHVPVGVAAALAEFGAREAAITLVMNPGADLTEATMRRLLERFGDDGEIREALLARPFLPAAIRSQLVQATASSLLAFAVDCAWLSRERAERVSREARDKANVTIVADTASGSSRKGLRSFVSHLRKTGQLTASLLLRALLSGRRDLFEAALVELSGLSEARVAGQLSALRGAGFAALSARAGLPPKFLPAFRAALEALSEVGASSPSEEKAELRLAMIERVLARCDRVNDGELERLVALLRRFEMEAAIEAGARQDAGARRQGVAATPRGPIVDMRALEAALAEAA